MKRSNQKLSRNAIAVAVLTASMCGAANAATVDPVELKAMVAEANQKGATPVEVHLAQVSLGQLQAGIAGVKSAMSQKSSQLLAELGPHAWTAGRWDNGLGSMGLYLTPTGLKMLQGSGNAISFTRGKHWMERTGLNDEDGRLKAIDSKLARDGFVDVVVTLNVEGLRHSFGANGEVIFDSNPATTDGAGLVGKKLLGGLSRTEGIAMIDPVQGLSGPGAQTAPSPEIQLRLSREGLVKLADSSLVRSMRPLGFKDSRAVHIDSDVNERAGREGSVDVIVEIRTPLSGGTLTRESFAAITASNKKAMDDVLATAGVSSNLKQIPEFGMLTGRLKASELAALRRAAHPALLRIGLNKPIATPQLATATATTHMANAWNFNPPIRGAGQNIIVIDTGVLRDHEFLRNSSGSSKVIAEACYGSNATLGGVTYDSVCPSADAYGDSFPGTVGSAAPIQNCSTDLPAICSHGTHVTGIAAGRQSSGFPLQGVAPDAGIIAVQVFSYDRARKAIPHMFEADLAEAMALMARLMVPGTTNPFVVNLSVGFGAYSGSCGSPDPSNPNNVATKFDNAVQLLKGMGVPVIAATGNGNAQGVGLNGKVVWPACVRNVVKAASVDNDGTGLTLSSFSNIADPTYYVGDFVLAPGGGRGVMSASSRSTGSVDTISGTSQAAAQVAGFYTLIKSFVPTISVDDASAAIRNSLSVPVPVTICSPAPCRVVNFRRMSL